ncbi:shikimate kinase [Neobacillus pocheonensis]|uniref:shikimate kinase n=1 Tax=Neobacillus pocheonensis TaxID=363869 RepID=UPI003D2E0EFB
MGVGKTTIGKLIAEKLNRKFIDIDEEIEKEFNMPVPQIFKEYGEKVFRDKEKSLIRNFCLQKNLIISVGGGAFLQEEIKTACLSSAIVVFLDLSFEIWTERISLIIDSRPVLQGKSIEEMKELFYSRQKIYADHHLTILTENKTPEEIAKLVIKGIQGEVVR